MCNRDVCIIQTNSGSQYLRTLKAETEALHYKAKGYKLVRSIGTFILCRSRVSRNQSLLVGHQSGPGNQGNRPGRG